MNERRDSGAADGTSWRENGGEEPFRWQSASPAGARAKISGRYQRQLIPPAKGVPGSSDFIFLTRARADVFLSPVLCRTVRMTTRRCSPLLFLPRTLPSIMRQPASAEESGGGVCGDSSRIDRSFPTLRDDHDDKP